LKKKIGNGGLTRSEEQTKAPTPDKFDRSTRENHVNPFAGKRQNPYPLTEEEATPTTPKSSQQ